MSVLALPMAPAGSVQEQVTQQYAYLVQMAQQLNLALGQLEALGGGVGEASARRQANGRLGTAASETADGQYETLRSMILKTADQVQKTTAALTAKLEEEYVASSDFGSYVAKLSAQLEAAPEAVTQYYSFFSDLQANVEKVDAAFAHYKLDTEGYIRTGIVYYDGAAPVYGVAVGQDLTCREVDGKKVVEQNNFRTISRSCPRSFEQSKFDELRPLDASGGTLHFTRNARSPGVARLRFSGKARPETLFILHPAPHTFRRNTASWLFPSAFSRAPNPAPSFSTSMKRSSPATRPNAGPSGSTRRAP